MKYSILFLVFFLSACGSSEGGDESSDPGYPSDAPKNTTVVEDIIPQETAETPVEIPVETPIDTTFGTGLISAFAAINYDVALTVIEDFHEQNDRLLASQGRLGSGSHIVEQRDLLFTVIDAFVDDLESYIYTVASNNAISPVGLENILIQYYTDWIGVINNDTHFEPRFIETETQLEDFTEDRFDLLVLNLLAVGII